MTPLRRALRPVALACAMGAAIGYLADLIFNNGEPWFLFRMALVALAVALCFAAFAVWPRALPPWLPRWALQVTGVAVTVPSTTFAIWSLRVPLSGGPFWSDTDRLMEFVFVTIVALLVSPWIALAVLVRQKEAFAREQEMAFRLARSELERREHEARLQLMQAQVAPHFLFNTLANVQALVECGSPRAPDLLRALTTYLRSAVPRVDGAGHSLNYELASVRAYLELMHMRMPDRLTFSIGAEPGTEPLRCPPLSVLTLVENAVQHGIDPSEKGGHIAIRADLMGTMCRIQVRDTGGGTSRASPGKGTGLVTLRKRLALTYGHLGALRLTNEGSTGFCAEIEFPAEEAKI